MNRSERFRGSSRRITRSRSTTSAPIFCEAACAPRLPRFSGSELLLGHLAAAGVPGLEGAAANDVAKRVRELDADAYMIATRETLQVAVWLKRAVQATFGGA